MLYSDHWFDPAFDCPEPEGPLNLVTVNPHRKRRVTGITRKADTRTNVFLTEVEQDRIDDIRSGMGKCAAIEFYGQLY